TLGDSGKEGHRKSLGNSGKFWLGQNFSKDVKQGLQSKRRQAKTSSLAATASQETASKQSYKQETVLCGMQEKHAIG
ncbi:hypothetical protein Tco_0536334, partial [Tanacetum coccineum]